MAGDVVSESAPEFLRGGGEMGERMRAHDWSATALGDPATWSQNLRAALGICLGSRFPIAIYWGPELSLLYNDAWSPILGAKHPWALGRAGREVWPELWDSIGPMFEQVMQRSESTYSEDQLLAMHRHGYTEECYFNYTFTPVHGEQRHVDGVFNAVIETTDRVIGERRTGVLRALSEALGGLVSAERACDRAAGILRTSTADAPFAAIYLLDEDGAARLAGSASLPAGSPALASVIRPGRDGDLWSLGEVQASHRVTIISVAERHFGGPPPGGPWPEPASGAFVAPLTAGQGAPLFGFLVLGISPRHAVDDAYRQFADRVGAYLTSAIASARAFAEEKLRAETLAELDRAKTTFFGNVSHEFRTPLTLMLGPLDDMRQAAEQGRAADRAEVELVQRNGLRLLKLVNSLLDFSRIEAGRIRAHYEPTDLGALTSDLASSFRAAIERAGLTLRVDCAPLGEPVFVDHDMWEKIVLNLLSNAFKHTFEGEIAVTLRLTHAGVELRVSDTGVGIEASELPRLFERFHRVERARSRTQEGTGIGLALVQELVRLHQGHITVTSAVDRGTIFTVTVPRGSAHLPTDHVRPHSSSTALGAAPFVEEAQRWLPGEIAPASTVAPPSSTGADRHLFPDSAMQGRIVVADDNADMRAYVSRLLGEYWTVESVADGREALAAARREPPALIVSDVMMPGLDGFQLIEALRADEPTRAVPVLLLSARAGEEAAIEGLEAGANDYLVKPFSARELLARVATQLALGQARAVEQQAQSRLRMLFQQAPVAVSVVRGPDFLYDLANPRYEALVGRSDIVGKTVREAFPELSDDDAIFTMLRRVRESGQPFTADEYRVSLVRQPGGEVEDVYFLYTCQPIPQTDEVLTVAVDVTYQVTARLQLEDVARREEAARQQAEQNSRAKDEFLSTLSHELRTPLNALVGWSHLLRTGAVPEAQRQRALETIERNARAQARLIDDLLDLGRIVQGKLVLSVGPVEMVRVVEAAIETMRLAAESKGVRLQPVLDSHATITGDADRLQQIVWNLLSNAIKFTPKGGRVQVRLRRQPSFVELTVADTGQGIEAEFLPHVFERFWQADGAITRKAGGLGLGLAIVRSLVELHGGTILARSDGPGLGATFTVRLPTAPLRAAPPDEPPASPREVPTGPPILRGLRVLVVDDDADTRSLLSFVLTQAQSHVTLASSTAVALALLAREPFDVLVSDIGMPGDDGLSLVRQLRRFPAPVGRVPALALTAYARSEDRTAALRAGFQMHLAKPIEPEELLVVVATLAEASRGGSDPG